MFIRKIYTDSPHTAYAVGDIHEGSIITSIVPSELSAHKGDFGDIKRFFDVVCADGHSILVFHLHEIEYYPDP